MALNERLKKIGKAETQGEVFAEVLFLNAQRMQQEEAALQSRGFKKKKN